MIGQRSTMQLPARLAPTLYTHLRLSLHRIQDSSACGDGRQSFRAVRPYAHRQQAVSVQAGRIWLTQDLSPRSEFDWPRVNSVRAASSTLCDEVSADLATRFR